VKFRREQNGRLLVSLTRGDDLRSSLQDLAADQKLVGASVHGIGALQDPELGWWDLPNQTYHKRVFPGLYELLTLQGNLSLLEGKPLLHAHVTLSGPDYQVFGGHFFEARVGVVAELFLDPCADPLLRVFCPSLGLPRWEPAGN
jgi:predicted DNA-binding protein with PD1-like motif